MLPLIRRHALLTAFVLVAAAGPAWAQADPPDRVARLNYLSGQVSFRPASLEEWGAATINYPLTTGDHLWTEAGATAELHVGAGVIRLAPETAFSFLNVDNEVVQARLAEGRLDLRVREIFEGETWEIDTPNAAVAILRPGTYQIEVDPEGDRTRVTVREGEAEMYTDRTFSLLAGQMADLIGIDNVGYAYGRAPAPDRWELWCRDRDRREDNRLALNYVSRDTIGYEDLDDYGTWSYVPEYGYAWQPTVVAVDWAPYRYGHWSFVRPWGWTWIDNARWGFAPFHYGRWMCYRDRWVWLPGQRHVRPIWAPALVAFVGHRDWHFSFAFGVRPAIGWFPLGPGEPYCPSYRASGRYLRGINVTNVKIANINMNTIDPARLRYANRNVPGAMTAVPRDAFVAAQPVQRVGTAVPRALADEPAIAGHGASATPIATSVLGHVPAAAARPPASVMRRPVVARNDPPAGVTQTAPVLAPSRRPLPDAGRPASPEVAAAEANAVGAESTAPRTSADRNAGDVAARPRSEGRSDNTTYVWPRTEPSRGWSTSNDRPATSARPRGEPATTDRHATDDRNAETTPQVGNDSQQSARPRASEAPSYTTPRYEAPTYQAPNYQAPRYQYEAPRAQATPREDRPAPNSERVAPREERPAPSREVRGAPAASESARPRAQERSQDRPAEPSHAAPAPSAPAPASRPAEHAAERPQAQPKSGGQADQNQSARPRPGGGRGGRSW